MDAGIPSMPMRRTDGRGGWRYTLVAAVTLSLVGLLVWLGAFRGGSSSEPTPTLGYVALESHEASDFQVRRIGGGSLSISEPLGAGTPIVLNLWASWCVPCREEMPAIERAAVQNPDVRIIGVAVQDIESAAESFATEVGVSFELGIDDGSVIDAYPTRGLPTTWFIDRSGMIVGQRFGEMSEAELTDRVTELLGR